MKRLDVLLVSLGLVALIATPVAAGCRVVHRCATPVVVEKVAIVEAIAAVPVVSAFVPAAVVAYGAAYLPGTGYAGTPYQQVLPQGAYAPPPPRAIPGAVPVGQEFESQSSLAILQRLEQRLGVMEQRAGIAPPQQQGTPMPPADPQQDKVPPPPPAQEPPPAAQGQAGADVLKLFTARCASCHQKGREGSGGGFVLLDGPRLASLSAAKQKQVLQRVYTTDTKLAMPRGGKPLTDEELGVVVGWLAGN